jgi:hypothetical protein
MSSGGGTDFLPIWGVFLATAAVALLSIEGGYRLGIYRRGRSEQEDRPPVGEMVAATLALLTLLLAFTFGLAASRFDVRRGLVIDEANAIGTTYLRAAMLPEPHRTEVRNLLREYVELRLEAVEPGKLARSIARSQEQHDRLWEHATAVGKETPGSIVVGLFIQSLNEVIDLHTKRLVFGAGNRIPGTTWVALYFLAVVGTAALGYHNGLAGSCRSPALLALVLAFTAVIALIVDLDRPQEGVLRVSQQAMSDLRNSMRSMQP